MRCRSSCEGVGERQSEQESGDVDVSAHRGVVEVKLRPDRPGQDIERDDRQHGRGAERTRPTHDRCPSERDQRSEEDDARDARAPGQTIHPRHHSGRVLDATHDEPRELERRRDVARIVDGPMPRPRVPHEIHGERRDDRERTPANPRLEQRADGCRDDEHEADPGRHERREQQRGGRERRPSPSLLDGDEAQTPNATEPTKPVWNAQKRFSAPLPSRSRGSRGASRPVARVAAGPGRTRRRRRPRGGRRPARGTGGTSRGPRREGGSIREQGTVDQCSLTGRR